MDMNLRKLGDSGGQRSLACYSPWGCRVRQDLVIKQQYDPAIPLLVIYQKEKKTLIWKNTCTSIFIAVLFTIAKIWKQHKCPSKQTDKEDVHTDTHTHTLTYTHTLTMEYYSAMKFATIWLDFEGKMLSEVWIQRKTHKEWYQCRI